MHPKIRRIEIEYKEDLSLEFIEGLIETAIPTTIFGFSSILLKNEISVIDTIFILVNQQSLELIGYVWIKKQIWGYWELHKSFFIDRVFDNSDEIDSYGGWKDEEDEDIEYEIYDMEKHIISKIIQEQYKLKIENEKIQFKLKDLSYIQHSEYIYHTTNKHFTSFEIICLNKTSYKGLEYYYDNSKKCYPCQISYLMY